MTTSSDLWATPPGDRWYSVQNALGGDDGPAEILIYDEINPIFGISAADFVNDLAKVTANSITVRINSPGGSVFDGIAILNALRGHPAQITTVVDGLAASIASVIAMGGDQVLMMPNSSLMCHNAWDIVVGNADDLQKAADTLRQFSSNLASIYADKAGGTVADWQAIMDAETWYTADEAVQAGLADRVVRDSPKIPSYARASFDLSKFKYPGRQHAPQPVIPRAQKNAVPPVQAKDNPKGKEPAVATSNPHADRLIDEAINARQIPASHRDQWRGRFGSDFPGAKAFLDQIPPGIALDLTPSASATAGPSTSAHDAEMARAFAKVTGQPLDSLRPSPQSSAPRRAAAGAANVGANGTTWDGVEAQLYADPELHRAAWQISGRQGMKSPPDCVEYFPDPNAPQLVKNADGSGSHWVEPEREQREASLREQAHRGQALREQQKERDEQARAALRDKGKRPWEL